MSSMQDALRFSPVYVLRYPLARSKNRKIIFHAGPTNSGKTYHALERLITAKSGVYCAPLKLLVAEVFNKCNQRVSIDCTVLFVSNLFFYPLHVKESVGVAVRYVNAIPRSTSQGTPCDLVTGEERTFAKDPDNAADHLSCSVEMVNLQNSCRCHTASIVHPVFFYARNLIAIPTCRRRCSCNR